MTVPFTIKVSTIHGDMLINRFDINQTNALVKTGAALDAEQIDVAQGICEVAEEGSIMLDVGANFGVYALSCAQTLKNKGGSVHAFEGQRILSYMIGGSTVLNGIENLYVHHACVGNSYDEIPIPRFDYNRVMNFGSIEFGDSQKEKLSQERGVSNELVKQVRIDDFNFEKVCFIKLDVEGMENKVISGAVETIKKSMPVMQIEILKSDKDEIVRMVREISDDYLVCQYGKYDIFCMDKNKLDFYGVNINNLKVIG